MAVDMTCQTCGMIHPVGPGYCRVEALQKAEAEVVRLEAQNARILKSHDAYADLYENEKLDRKAAEDDLTKAEAEVAQLRAACAAKDAALNGLLSLVGKMADADDGWFAGDLPAEIQVARQALTDETWLEKQIKSCKAEAEGWSDYKKTAMRDALDGESTE